MSWRGGATSFFFLVPIDPLSFLRLEVLSFEVPLYLRICGPEKALSEHINRYRHYILYK